MTICWLYDVSMPSTLKARSRDGEFSKIVETEQGIRDLRKHLDEIVESTAFKGSQRSAQFLKYVVERAIAGQFDALKERSIGVELFGRTPAYDTSEDAIVRVTAIDVRKRLQLHYSSYDKNVLPFRISLPPGGYVPKIIWSPITPIDDGSPQSAPASSEPASATPPIVNDQEALHARAFGLAFRRWLLLITTIILLNLVGWAIAKKYLANVANPSQSVSPWATLFDRQRVTLLITSDPNIAEIQGLTGVPVSLSDYANRHYLPEPSSLSPQIEVVARNILRGDKASNVDTPIVASIAELAEANKARLVIRGARDLRMTELDTDSNFIFLGSPRTNPWASLFSEQLDFRFIYDKNSHQEILLNAHPRAGELSVYVPTAKGFATGESFATIGFVRNRNQAGDILLLAGANAEGTSAAGELVTNIQSLKAALQHCGTDSIKTGQHFQLLLHLNMMAGSPTNFDIAACHLLP